jgi:hypothetical protein
VTSTPAPRPQAFLVVDPLYRVVSADGLMDLGVAILQVDEPKCMIEY